MNSQQRDEIARTSWVLAAIALILFMAGLWHQPFINFESRFALFAQEMLRHGPTLFPTTYGRPYPDYPVTGTLLIWLCSLPCGEITRFGAVFPTAVAAALNLALLYRLLAPYSRQWAAMAVCLQLMTLMFIAEARSISLDQMIATVTLLSVYLLDSAARHADRSAQRRLLQWLPLVLLIGFAVRGPLGVVIPTAAMCAYCAAMQNWNRLWRIVAIAAIVLVVAWGALLAATAHLYGTAFVHDVLTMQVFGRLESKGETQSLQYFTRSFGNYAPVYPFAIIVAAGAMTQLFKNTRTSSIKMLCALLLWTLVVMIGMSIPHVKKARYILPVVPALAAIAAYPWNGEALPSLRWFKKIVEIFFAIVPALLLLAIAIASRHMKRQFGDLSISLPTIYIVLAIAQAAAAWIYFKAAVGSRAIAQAAIAALAIWSTHALVAEPALQQLHDTARFTHQVEAARERNPGALVLFGMTEDGEAIKYLVNVPHDLFPVFARSKDELLRAARPLYVVVSERDIEKIADVVPAQSRILTGRFDGHPFSAFYLPE